MEMSELRKISERNECDVGKVNHVFAGSDAFLVLQRKW